MSRLRRAIAAHPDITALVLILLIGAGLRVAFFPRAPIFIHGDSTQYYVPAHDLMDGQGLQIPLKRPPVYPVFIAAVGTWLGENLSYLAAVQHLLGLGTVALTYGLGRLTFGRTAAVFGGLVAALSGGLLIYEHYVMTESVFTFLLALAVFLYVAGVRRDSTWWYVGSGLAIGLATLTRPHAQLLLLLGPPVVALYWRRRGPVVRATLAATAAAAVVMLPWMARNQAVYGTFTVAGALGQNLVMQTLAFHNGAFTFYDAANPPDDPNSKRRWARKHIQERNDDKLEKPWLEVTGIGIHGRLMHELKIGEAEADALMRDVAIEAIRARPLTYLRLAFDDFRMILMGVPDDLAFHWRLRESRKWPRELAHLVEPPTAAQEAGRDLTERLVNLYQGPRLGPIVPGLFVVGLLASLMIPAWRPALIPGLTVLVCDAVSAATVAFVTRYHHPPDPLMHVVAFGGILVIGRQLVGLAGRLRGSRPAPLPSVPLTHREGGPVEA